MHRKLIAPLYLAAALGGAAFAALPQPAAAAPDKGLGMAIMSAYVGSDGTLLAGHGVISSERAAPGRYHLRLSRNVSLNDCAVSATTISHNFASLLNADDNLVAILTHNGFDGSAFDAAFQVMVFCAR